MKDNFFKYPSTPHLAVFPGLQVREDKVLSPSDCDEFLRHNLIVEEKMDGANLGISFDREGNVQAQNRGRYLRLPESGQWKMLEGWLAPRVDSLFEYLGDRLILFGEWCYAKHSVYYDCLPDWFLGFDVYDKVSGRFFSSERRDALFDRLLVQSVPLVAEGHFTLPELVQFLSSSKFTDEPAEGLYLRIDEGGWLGRRAKLVRPAFLQSIEEHWSRSPMTPNRLKSHVSMR